MHFVCLLAVEADSEAEARSMAESFLEPYGNGDVWDWYEIGGRWSGIFDGKDLLRYPDNPVVFRNKIEDSLQARDGEFRSLIRGFRENPVFTLGDSLRDHPDHPDRDLLHRRMNEGITKNRAEWEKVLNADSLRALGEDVATGMLGYQLWKLGKLIAGYFNSESYFFDAEYHSASTEQMWERVEADPDNQWLVVVDLHN